MPENTTLSHGKPNLIVLGNEEFFLFHSRLIHFCRIYLSSFFPWIMQTPSNIKHQIMRYTNRNRLWEWEKKQYKRFHRRTEVICWSLLTFLEIKLHPKNETTYAFKYQNFLLPVYINCNCKCNAILNPPERVFSKANQTEIHYYHL